MSMSLSLGIGINRGGALPGALTFGAGGASPLSFDFQSQRFFSGGARQDSIYDIAPSLERAGNATTVDENGNVVYVPQQHFLNTDSPATQTITTITSGVDYTVKVYGSGSVALSGAGTGTATDGSPVEITASSTSLTCTVSGSPDYVSVRPTNMQDVPTALRGGGFSDLLIAAGSARYLARTEHHLFEAYSTSHEAPASALTDLNLETDPTLGTGWSGSAETSWVKTAGSGTLLSFDFTFVPGQTYRITLPNLTTTGGSMGLQARGVSTETIASGLGGSQTVFYFTPGVANTLLSVTSGASTEGSLSQPIVELVGELDAEQLSNGDFSDGLTGWVDASGGLAFSSVSSGQANINNDTGDGLAGIAKSFTTEIGETYLITGNLVSTLTGARLGAGNSANNVSLADSGQVNATGTQFLVFTATAATTFVNVYTFPNAVTTANQTSVWDNISVKPIGPAGDWDKKRLALASAVTNDPRGGYSTPTAASAIVTNLVVTDDAGYGFEGAGSCARFTGSGVSALHRVQVGTLDGAANRGIGAWLPKSSTHRYVQFFGTTANEYANFDLVTGAVGSVGSGWTSARIEANDRGLFWQFYVEDPATGTGAAWLALVDSASAGYAANSATSDYIDIAHMDCIISGSGVAPLPVRCFGASTSYVADNDLAFANALVPAYTDRFGVAAKFEYTYADENANPQMYVFRWDSTNEEMALRLDTGGADTGTSIGIYENVVDGAGFLKVGSYTPGTEVRVQIAALWTDADLFAAKDGTSGTNANPTQTPTPTGDVDNCMGIVSGSGILYVEQFQINTSSALTVTDTETVTA